MRRAVDLLALLLVVVLAGPAAAVVRPAAPTGLTTTGFPSWSSIGLR